MTAYAGLLLPVLMSCAAVASSIAVVGPCLVGPLGVGHLDPLVAHQALSVGPLVSNGLILIVPEFAPDPNIFDF